MLPDVCACPEVSQKSEMNEKHNIYMYQDCNAMPLSVSVPVFILEDFILITMKNNHLRKAKKTCNEHTREPSCAQCMDGEAAWSNASNQLYGAMPYFFTEIWFNFGAQFLGCDTGANH